MTKEFSKQQIIEKNLRDSLDIKFLHVENQSKLHAGHSGDDGSGESHYRVTIESNELKGLSRLTAHKKILGIIGGDIIKTTHSISLILK